MNLDDKKHIIAILGGDRRQSVIAQMLLDRGHDVRLFGLGEYGSECTGAELCSNVERAIMGSEIILLPLPVTRDNMNLTLQRGSGEHIPLSYIVKLAHKSGAAAILGGMIPDEVMRIGESYGLYINDYYRNEKLQQKNALPSAEGALMIAMENTEITLLGMKALVTGFGRIGALLASILSKLGVDVSVAARREETLCEIAMSGYKAVRICEAELVEEINNCDVIFNTVPHIVITDSIIEKVNNKPLYIEIASAPGGIDRTSAGYSGFKTLFAPSLPGKYSPISAGRYIFETVSDILSERSITL